MTTGANPLNRSGSAGAAGAGESNSPPTQGRVAAGLNATRDIITSAASTAGAKAGEWKAHGASFLYTVFVGPLSWAWGKLTSLVNWARGSVRGEPAEIVIEVTRKGWFSNYVERVELTTALANKDITPEEAMKKYGEQGCDKNYLTARGYGIVKFKYTWLGMTYNYEGKLRTALRKGYITPAEAIDQNMFTKEQAIIGKWVPAEKPAKETK